MQVMLKIRLRKIIKEQFDVNEFISAVIDINGQGLTINFREDATMTINEEGYRVYE